MRTVDNFKGLLDQHYNFANYKTNALRGEMLFLWLYKFLVELEN